MAKVLFVKANDRPAEQAVSVQLYEAFLSAYRDGHPDDSISEIDLFREQLPYYGNTVMSGIYKLANGLEPSAEERAAADIANRHLDQFLTADKLAIAFPLWNFTVPAPLVTYVSYLLQAGKTFKYTAEGSIGLAADKKLALLNARGGDYSQEAMASAEMAMNLMKTSFQLMGITDPLSVVVEGHNMYPDRAKDIVREGLREAREAAARF